MLCAFVLRLCIDCRAPVSGGVPSARPCALSAGSVPSFTGMLLAGCRSCWQVLLYVACKQDGLFWRRSALQEG